MDIETPTLSLLFAQLGLPSEQADIDAFVEAHTPLPDDVKLADAPYWTEPQAKLLKGELLADGDWAPVIDELNVLLHEQK